MVSFFESLGNLLLFFWQTAGVTKIFRLFWFFFIFEFPRYILFDFLVIFYAKLKMHFMKKEYESARLRLLEDNPLISVIVPGRNEGKHIPKLVASLSEQTFKNMEIIVIDDGSDDDTPYICRELQKRGKIHRYLRNDIRGGKASAENFGFEFASGRFIVHIDSDSSFDRDAMEKILIPFYINSRIGIVAGNVKVRDAHKSLCTSLQAVEYLKSISIGRMVSSTLGILRIASGAFGAFRRDLVYSVRGWDVGPGMDGDITVKARKAGYRIYFEPSAICYTSVPETFQSLAKQRLRWSRSLVRFRIRKHRNVFVPSENFSFSTLLSFLEDIFYSLVLDIKWLIYIVDVLLHFPSMALYIIPANYLLYVAANIVQFLVILWGSERKKQESTLFIYLPLMPIYAALFMRFVRTYAYIQELFFKVSYKDKWNPQKVSVEAKKFGL